MDAWVPIVVAALALGGPLLGYLIKVRQASGRVASSDAAALWAEAGAIRREYAERIRTLEARVTELEARNLELIHENYRLQRVAMGNGHA